LTNPRRLFYYGGMIRKSELQRRAEMDIMSVRTGSPEYQMIRRACIATGNPYRRTKRRKNPINQG